jgi:hypothetical protein
MKTLREGKPNYYTKKLFLLFLERRVLQNVKVKINKKISRKQILRKQG